jgi:hypothetical protein
MSFIRYLLDENVDPLFRKELLRNEPTIVVWKVGDAGVPPRGTSDSEILTWCEDNSFILITNNRKSMPNHVADHIKKGRHIPGIFELNSNMSINETVDELLLIWGASNINEYQDVIIYLPVT